MENGNNIKFYPAKEMKNHFECEVETIQFGKSKHTRRKSALKRQSIGRHDYMGSS